MHWIKLGVYFLTAMLAAGVLVLSVILITFDNDDYKKWFVRGVYRLSGYHLMVDGSFSVTLSAKPKLSATQVRIVSPAGDILLLAKNIDIQVALKPLFRKSLIIKNLVINEAVVNLDLRRFLAKKRDRLPVVVLVEHAKIHNTTLTLQIDQDTENTLRLVSFEITEPEPGDLLTLSATGFVNERGFSINGKLGSISQLYHPLKPYPVQINAQSTNTRIAIRGSIDDPLGGHGLDLTFKSETSDIRSLLDALDINSPWSGKLSIAAALYGDYVAPMATDIKLEFIRHNRHAFYAKGSIDNILSGRNTDLRFHGSVRHASLIRWLLPDSAPLFRKLTFSGNLQKTTNQYWINDITTHLISPDGLEIFAKGGTAINNPADHFPFQNLALNLTVSAPTTTAAKSLLFDAIPEMGPVHGSAKLISKKNVFALKKVDITLGEPQGDSLTMKGSIGQMPIESDIPNSDMNFDLLLRSKSSWPVSQIIGQSLPELGPVNVSGQFHGSANESVIRNISLEAGTQDQLQIKSDGLIFLNTIADDVKAQEHLNFQISGNTQTALETLAYLESSSGSSKLDPTEKQPTPHIPSLPKELGQISMTGMLSNLDGTLGIENLNLQIKKNSSFVLTSTGTIGDLANREELNFDYTLNAENLADIGKLFNIAIPDLGPFKQTGRVVSKENATNLMGAATLGNTQFSQELTLKTDGERPHLTGTLLIPVLHKSTISRLLSAYPGKRENQAERADENPVAGLFSRTPLSLEFLNKIDLDLGVYCNKLEGTGFDIDRSRTEVTLTQSKLRVQTEISAFEGGKATFNLHIAPHPTPRLKLIATGNDVDIKKTLLLFNEDANAEGKANFSITLDGTGKSPYDIASTLTGQLGIVVESGKIINRNLSLFVFDFIGWLFNYAENKKSTKIDCAIVQFGFDNGKGKSQALFVHTPSLNAVGQSEINLAEESIDLLVNVQPIGRLLATTVPIQIRGNLTDPKVNIIPKNKAIATYGKLLFSPLGYLRSQLSKTLKAITGNGRKKATACNLQEFSAAGEEQ